MHAYGYILFLIFAAELSDIVAYICGRMWGKHPLRSEISPKKTWEGRLAALAVSMVLPWAMWFSFPHFGPLELLLTGLIVGVGGQVGDLSISVIKRDVAIKDMGTVIPGHGGILDRIDSLIYVSPLFFHMAGYYYGLRYETLALHSRERSRQIHGRAVANFPASRTCSSTDCARSSR